MSGATTDVGASYWSRVRFFHIGFAGLPAVAAAGLDRARLTQRSQLKTIVSVLSPEHRLRGGDEVYVSFKLCSFV